MAEAAAAPKAPAATPEAPKLTRVQKLAILLVILGPDAAGQLLRGLAPDQVETISTEMAKVTMVSQEVQAEILGEFSQVAVDAGTAIRGGLEVTRTTLEKALGLFKATQILSRVAPSGSSVAAIQEISDLEPREIFNLVRHEQPQTVALVLSYVGSEKAAGAIALFQAEQRDKILERIATLAPTPVEVVEKVAEVLVAKRGASRTRALSQTGGVKTAADVVNAMEKTQGNSLLGLLEERNPELGKSIRQKMFTFEDLASLDASVLQRLLREVDTRELALALKSASEKLKTKLLACITKRAAETVQEEITFLGAVRLRDIENAQLAIIDSVRRLEAEGAIDLGEARKEAKNEMV
jgi:flagellar motor switch protein FliG